MVELQELFKADKGKTVSLLPQCRDDNFVAISIRTLVQRAYYEIEIYTELYRQAKSLRLVYAEYASQLSPDVDPRPNFLDDLFSFYHFLAKTVEGTSRELFPRISNSPHLGHCFDHQLDPDGTTIETRLKPGLEHTLAKHEQSLFCLPWVLVEDSIQLRDAGRVTYLDKLERLLQTEPRTADLVSSRMVEIISNATILSQCQYQIKMFHPWVMGFDQAVKERAKDIKAKYDTWYVSVMSMAGGAWSRYQQSVRIAPLVDTYYKRFFYPVHKRRTKYVVEALRGAEKNLDELWEAIDKIMGGDCNQLHKTAVGTLLHKKRTLQRTPEWLENGVTDRKKDSQGDNGNIAMLLTPLSILYFDDPGTGRAQLSTPKKKLKIKTKGEVEDKLVPVEVPDVADQTPLPAPKFEVDACSLKVFRMIFFDPEATSTPGEVSWHDFLHAMTSTGLFSAEKLYESAWQFERLDAGHRTGIQFHQPQPRGKIPLTNARRIGRRLTRAFGWMGEMFVLKGSQGCKEVSV